jgi:hypothetical protein
VKHISKSETIKAVYELRRSLSQDEAIYISNLEEKIIGKSEYSHYF